MTSLFRIALATLLLASCAPAVDFEFEAESENLSAKATITEITFARRFGDGFAKLSGNVAIKNTSSQVQNYGNGWLWLHSGDGVQKRAFLDSLASHHIDIDVVEIQPDDSLELAVYWVFPKSKIEKLGENSFFLEIRPSDDQ